MGKFYRLKGNSADPIWVYSERGVLGYAFSTFVVESPALILNGAINGDGTSLAEAVGSPSGHRVLTEFDLGSDGFGNPDAGLLIQTETRTSFVFIEGKAVAFRQSWKQPPILTTEEAQDLSDLDVRCRGNSFNSSINGQLELRWRFVNSLRAAVACGQTLVSEEHAPPPTALQQNDRFYWRRRLDPRPGIVRHWRRVAMDGLMPLWNVFNQVDDFYLMAITRDSTRPTALDELRLFDDQQTPLNDVGKRVYWLAFDDLAGLLEEVPTLENSDDNNRP